MFPFYKLTSWKIQPVSSNTNKAYLPISLFKSSTEIWATVCRFLPLVVRDILPLWNGITFYFEGFLISFNPKYFNGPPIFFKNH